MKIKAILCSPRKNGNTEFLLNEFLEEAYRNGAETERRCRPEQKRGGDQKPGRAPRLALQSLLPFRSESPHALLLTPAAPTRS